MEESSKSLKLTPKQRIFVAEYMIDLNATQAAIRAGYSEDTARQIGTENLAKPAIQAEIERRQIDKAARAEITADKVLSELAKIAFFDTRKLLNEDGTPKPIQELDDETARAIAGIDVVNVGNAELGQGQILKYKVADKNKALEQLCKHLGLNAPKKIDHTSNGNQLKSITIVNAEGLLLDNNQ